jgi:two-component system cell cycle sensor histidine kinase/response regulator CckA
VHPPTASQDSVILVVEDEPGLRQLACAVLEQAGYRTLEAEDGRQAVEILSRPPAHIVLVLSDIRMPNLNGMELEQIIRRRWPTLPVLLMSGTMTREWVVRVREHSLYLLRKPFRSRDLLDSVKELIEPDATGEKIS